MKRKLRKLLTTVVALLCCLPALAAEEQFTITFKQNGSSATSGTSITNNILPSYIIDNISPADAAVVTRLNTDGYDNRPISGNEGICFANGSKKKALNLYFEKSYKITSVKVTIRRVTGIYSCELSVGGGTNIAFNQSNSPNQKPGKEFTVPISDPVETDCLNIEARGVILSAVTVVYDAVQKTPAATPKITAPEPVKVGSVFNFSATDGATEFNYQYALSADPFTAAPTKWTGNGTGASFTVPNDAAGQYLYLSVTAGGEGFTESPVPAVWNNKVADLDKAAKPTITAPAELKAGQEFQFNTETAGAQISYQVAREDAELSGTDTPMYGETQYGSTYYVSDADADKWLYFRVWAGGTGFENSEYTEEHFKIAANPTAKAPTINHPEAAAEVRGGAEITFTTEENTYVEYSVAYSAEEIAEDAADYVEEYGQPFVLPYDKAGQYIYIKAIAKGTGFNESPAAYWHALVQPNPAANKPVINEPAELKVGQTFTFTTDQKDVTISYKYAISETPLFGEITTYSDPVEGTSFDIPADANGKMLYLYVTADGDHYTVSEPATAGYKIKKSSEPVFVGQDVFDSSNLTAGNSTPTGSFSAFAYTAENINITYNSCIGVGTYDKSGILANTSNDSGLLADYVSYEGELYQAYDSNIVDVYVSNSPITLSNYNEATFVATLSPTNLRAAITGEFQYVAIVRYVPAGTYVSNSLSPKTINIGWKQAPAEPETSLDIFPVPSNDTQIKIEDTEVGDPDESTGWVRYIWTVSGPSSKEFYDVELTFKGYEYVAYATMADNTSAEPLNAPARRAAADGFTTPFAELETNLATAGYTDVKQVKLNENGEATIQLPVANYGGTADANVAPTHYILFPGYAAAEGENGVYNMGADAGIASTVYYDESTSVIGIEADGAEAEYYTLQGVRVAQPENGIYVKVVNGKASKVLVK